MPEELANRFKAIVNRKAELDRAAGLELEAKQELERENATKKEAASARWTVAVEEIEAAITQTNKELASSGLKFGFDPGSPPTSPAIAQSCIHLTEVGDQLRRSIVLHVNAYGHVQPAFDLFARSHSPAAIRPKDFALIDANQNTYMGLMAEFLERVFAALP
jgi:hypothetical protein